MVVCLNVMFGVVNIGFGALMITSHPHSAAISLVIGTLNLVTAGISFIWGN